MNKKYHFCLSGICFLTAFLIVMSGVRKQDEALASRIAPSILRFHVLANSDSSEDQAMKLEVKDFLLEKIRTEAGENTGKQELCQYLAEHRDDLEKAAGELIRSRGFSYGASIRLEICEFPARTYGDMTFPAGTYEAVRVLLGEGQGKNFWCVLYPSLCYTDSLQAVMPEDSENTLKALLPEEDFYALFTARKMTAKAGAEKEQSDALPQMEIRFKFLEWLPFHDFL